jgi:hypothetical protein
MIKVKTSFEDIVAQHETHAFAARALSSLLLVVKLCSLNMQVLEDTKACLLRFSSSNDEVITFGMVNKKKQSELRDVAMELDLVYRFDKQSPNWTPPYGFGAVVTKRTTTLTPAKFDIDLGKWASM